MALVRLTKLEAVNLALEQSQLTPVESLQSGDLDAEKAESILNRVIVEVLTRGWHWNTRVLELSPNQDGKIVLGETTLKVDATDPCIDITMIGNELFDLKDNTFIFDDPIELRLIITLEFEQLPQSFRNYCAWKTARIFQNNSLADPTLDRAIQIEEQAAWAGIIREDINSNDYNHIAAGRNSSWMVARRRPNKFRRT